MYLRGARIKLFMYAFAYEFMGRYAGTGVNFMDGILDLFRDDASNNHFASLPIRVTQPDRRTRWIRFLRARWNLKF